MPTISFRRPESGMSVDQLANLVAIVTKELEWLITGNLDVANIKANGIEAKNIKAGSITTDKIDAGAVTASKIDVDQLSAISADLGEIDAGKITGIEIYGSYIATADGTYPRSEMDVNGNYFAALASATSYLRIDPVLYGAPAIRFDDGAVQATMRTFSGVDFYFSISSNQDVQIEADGNINLVCDSVFVPSWIDLFNTSSGHSLQDDLDAKANTFVGDTVSIPVITSVDFTGQTTTSSTLNFINGILTSVT